VGVFDEEHPVSSPKAKANVAARNRVLIMVVPKGTEK